MCTNDICRQSTLLACGPIPPNPAELLGSKSMKELLGQAYSMYDLVILICHQF